MSSGAAFSLSVVIPNHNDGRYLGESIGSVLRQRPLPDELIVVDDASTDNSVAIIQDLIRDCPFARLVRNPTNVGVNRAFNIGIREARSRYVYCLSANDFLAAGVFARARQCLERYPDAGLWSAMMWMTDQDGMSTRIYPSAVVSLRDRYFGPPECRRLARRLGSWFAGTMIYRRDALDEVGGFDPSLGAFSDLFACLAISSRHGAIFSPVPLASLRRHEGSFLDRTLQDPIVTERVLGALLDRGRAIAPALYDEAMNRRTKARIRFAAIRSRKSFSLTEPMVARHWWAEGMLALARALPASANPLKTALLFLALRPFDIAPMVWYRALGSIAVGMGVRMSRR